MAQIMCQLIWISSYFISSVVFVMLRCFQRLAPLQRGELLESEYTCTMLSLWQFIARLVIFILPG